MTPSARNSLPVISVDQPCPQAWDAMAGDDKNRFCTHCNRHVHDLSAMTTAEAADLICKAAGKLCVRYQPTVDGAVKTLDYAPQTPVGRWWKRCVGAAVVAAFGAGAGNIWWHRRQPPPPPVVMGVMVIRTPPASGAQAQPSSACPAVPDSK